MRVFVLRTAESKWEEISPEELRKHHFYIVYIQEIYEQH